LQRRRKEDPKKTIGRLGSGSEEKDAKAREGVVAGFSPSAPRREPQREKVLDNP